MEKSKVKEALQVFIVSLVVVLACACNNGSRKTVPAFSFKTYPAYWVERDGSRRIGFLSIQITPRVKTDSSTNTSLLQADTLIGYTQNIGIVDSLKKPVLDSAGKQKYTIRQFLITNSKDTIEWLDHRDVDSLLKIKGKLKQK